MLEKSALTYLEHVEPASDRKRERERERERGISLPPLGRTATASFFSARPGRRSPAKFSGRGGGKSGSKGKEDR